MGSMLLLLFEMGWVVVVVEGVGLLLLKGSGCCF